MSPAKQRLLMAIGRNALNWALVDARRGIKATGVIALEGSAPFAVPELLASVRQAWIASGVAGNPVELRVVLNDAWLSRMQMPWSRDMLNAKTAMQSSQSFMDAYWGSDEAGRTCVLDDAPYGMPRLVLGVSNGLLAGLEALAREYKAGPVLIRPLSVAISQWLQGNLQIKGFRLAIESTHAVTFVEVVRGRMLTLTDMACAGGAVSVDTLEARLRLRCPEYRFDALPRIDLTLDDRGNGWLSSGATGIEALLRGLDQEIPSSEKLAVPLRAIAQRIVKSHPLDFVSSTTWFAGWRKWAVAAALVGLTGSAYLLNKAQSELAIEQRHIASVRVQQSRLHVRDDARVEDRVVVPVSHAVRQLNVPIVSLMRALRPPKDIPVFLLGVDLADAANGRNTARIIAEAENGWDMASYVGYLGFSKPFYRAYLVNHEEDKSGDGHSLRFVVEAEWAE